MEMHRFKSVHVGQRGAEMAENGKPDAVIGNDVKADGQFYYAVESAGILCRPSCKSKVPVRKNVIFLPAARMPSRQAFDLASDAARSW
jgi:methylphosphotriester-DNA--protein-cysteine methyltransferase